MRWCIALIVALSAVVSAEEGAPRPETPNRGDELLAITWHVSLEHSIPTLPSAVQLEQRALFAIDSTQQEGEFQVMPLILMASLDRLSEGELSQVRWSCSGFERKLVDLGTTKLQTCWPDELWWDKVERVAEGDRGAFELFAPAAECFLGIEPLLLLFVCGEGLEDIASYYSEELKAYHDVEGTAPGKELSILGQVRVGTHYYGVRKLAERVLWLCNLRDVTVGRPTTQTFSDMLHVPIADGWKIKAVRIDQFPLSLTYKGEVYPASLRVVNTVCHQEIDDPLAMD